MCTPCLVASVSLTLGGEVCQLPFFGVSACKSASPKNGAIYRHAFAVRPSPHPMVVAPISGITISYRLALENIKATVALEILITLRQVASW